jgi:hypothetical protein
VIKRALLNKGVGVIKRALFVRQPLKLFAPGTVTRYDTRRIADVEVTNAGGGSNESHAGAAANARDA